MKRSREEYNDDDMSSPKRKKRKLNHDEATTGDVSENTNNNKHGASAASTASNDELKESIDELTNDGFSMEDIKKAITLSLNDIDHVIHENDEKYSDDEEIAFFLTKSSFVASENNGKYNKYSLFLDEIITTSCSSSIIEKCIIFNYKIDPEWIFAVCPILKNKKKVENIYIFHGESMDEHYKMVHFQEIYDHLRLYKIKMNISYGTHHTKMIILCYKNEGIRIVITTANMIQRDWCYKTNGIYLQDFPLKTNNISKSHESEFESTLFNYCNQLKGLSGQTVMNFTFLNNYDFSSAKILLIPSCPGYHKGDKIDLFGHKRLKYLLNRNNITNTNNNHHNFIANISSIGSLNESWIINEFLPNKNNKLKVLWPTVHSVQNSVEGYSAGGSLCFPYKNCKQFLFKYFNIWNGSISGRMRLMPHIKTYSCIDTKTQSLKYFVLTSSNLSVAAWGKLQKNNQQLFIRSFEMGCLYLPCIYINNYIKHKHRGFYLTDLPINGIKRNLNTNNNDRNNDLYQYEFEMLYQLNKNGNNNNNNNDNKRKIIFPIPMEVIDTKQYTKNDKPWVWDLQYNKPDLFGSTWPPLL